MINRNKLTKLPRLFLALASLSRIRTWGPFLETWEKTKFNHAFSVSWSQGGEDLALMQLLPKKAGRYIDVGAHHPSRFSVTRHLYQSGWRGLNIDANPDAIASLIRERPQDISLNVCIGTQPKYLFHIFNEPAISTNNEDWRKKFEDENQIIKETIEIEGATLYSLINNYFDSRPDLLIVDAEGSDYDVLQSCNWNKLSLELWPLWIVCETTPPASSVQISTHIELLLKLGYEIYCILPMSTILKLHESSHKQ
jgi:FkbM family methyltransferase